MASTAARNWNQIVVWGVAVIVILALLGWWTGMFQQWTGSTGPTPQATTTETPAPAPQAEPTAPAGQPSQPTQTQ